MSKAQQKFGLQLVRTLKKNRSSPPFLRPVDPVALLIPDYHRVITQPIDLGSIEAKLNSTGKAMTAASKYGKTFGLDYSGVGEWEGKSPVVYRTAAEFREDVDRVWDNCYRYNGPKDKNPVSAMAGVMQDVSEKLFRTMPSAPALQYTPEPPRLPSPEVVRRPSKSFTPTAELVRPKREIHAPARELPYEQADGGKSRHGRVSGKTAQEQLRYCKEVIKELFKKVHEPYAYPFYEPVNYVALNIPQYPSIVRKPMDLGTVRMKLDQNLYSSPAYGPFENDVRQTFKNCYLFNPPGTAVHDWGRKLEGVFDAKWNDRPMGDDGDDGSDDDGITEMERQLERLQADIEARKQAKKLAKEQQRAAERAPKPPKPSTSKKAASTSEYARNRATAQSSASSHRKRPSGGNGGKKSSKKSRKQDSSDEDDEEMMMHQPSSSGGEVSFEMKRELAVKIVSFEGENLERAIDIIRQGRPDLLSDVNKEIELDIDQLDQRTLLALYRFVCPGSATNNRKQPKAAARRSATGGTKRKNLDEIKESERIERLEAQLREFEGAPTDSRRNSTAADADEASSDSSSEGESDSDSDEED
ncbi:bromodomain-containing factor 1, partial [Phenoliferia sp. Uapishka_3]